jgi:hypothetical protein
MPRFSFFTCFRLIGLSAFLVAASEAQFSKETFQNPPIEARPGALWT